MPTLYQENIPMYCGSKEFCCNQAIVLVNAGCPLDRLSVSDTDDMEQSYIFKNGLWKEVI